MEMLSVMRTSASRPELLEKSTASLLKHLDFGEYEPYEWLIHEDVLNGAASARCRAMVEESGLYSVKGFHNPPITQSASLTWLLNQVKTKFVLNWEDDFEAIADIDIQRCIDLMRANEDIRQIAFHKRGIMTHRYTFKKEQIQREEVYLTTNPHWAFTPALWRTSYIVDKWNEVNFPKGCNPVWPLNFLLKQLPPSSGVIRNAHWMMTHVGCYFLGKIGEGHYVNHLGTNSSVRTNAMKW